VIRSLYIKDFALIDELEVGFKPGLNILTGQTGAGKSIIIGALNMILGERADTELVRQGAPKAIVEAEIHSGKNERIQKLLEKSAVEPTEVLILRREIRHTGSRGFINDTPVRIGVLREIGKDLVDLHGQHDHQYLLDDENHRSVIDNFDTVKRPLERYQVSWRAMRDLQQGLEELKNREREIRDKVQLYQFQARELEQADLDPEEPEALQAEMNLLDNAEELDQKADAIVSAGSGDRVSLLDLLGEVSRQMEEMAQIEPDFESWVEEVGSARISIQEAIQFTERYRDGIEFNPVRLEELRKRQSDLKKLQKKYARDIPELIAYLEEIHRELDLSENFDLEIEKLQKKIDAQSADLKSSALALHEARKKAGEELARGIEEKLLHLGINSPAFRVESSWLTSSEGWFELDGQAIECTRHGCEQIHFYISTNKGESPKPLARIASGGEVSRVMLALKSIIAREQHLPVMIFDEIDTGISGHISEKVGRAMNELAASCQIIAITHQPQIASQAHNHFRVEKGEAEGRTVTRIIPLSKEEHVREVAGLMSGEEITEAAINSARELIVKSTG